MEPTHGAPAKTQPRIVVASPGEVRVFRTDGLGVVVREQRRVFVPSAAELFEPFGETCVERSASRLRKGCVGDLPRQGVLERVLDLACE